MIISYFHSYKFLFNLYEVILLYINDIYIYIYIKFLFNLVKI